MFLAFLTSPTLGAGTVQDNGETYARVVREEEGVYVTFGGYYKYYSCS